MLIYLILAAIVGIGIGITIAIIGKMQVSGKWSNTEFDGTMFIFIISIAFCFTLLGTFLKKEFAALETTKTALDLFENLFMIIVGYLFKKAVNGNGNSNAGGVKGG